MTILTIFKSTLPSVNFTFGNGAVAAFVQGVYRTADQRKIDDLNYEISQGHPHIYIDEAEKTVDAELVDPMNALRAKIIAEYVAATAAATSMDNDRGTSDQSKGKAASTSDVAAAAAGGSGAQLANLASTLAKKA